MESEIKKSRTLKSLIKEHGPSGVAEMLGVGKMTIWRWLNKVSKPRGLYARELEKMGVRI